MLKGQDIVVLAALMDGANAGETFAQLGKRTCLSASEAYACINRLQTANLLNSGRCAMKRNVLEFLVHGLRYAFPFRFNGMIVKGLATSYAAPIANSSFATSGIAPVWSYSGGESFGRACVPLYPTAPAAAAKDRALYDKLALIDMLRGGRLRERLFAEAKLKELVR
ncbi:MAG: hypothetical protein IJI35_16690 [Kiritimatiellae bacterium]|nr:hypothetical protein [Kiritimatiellia bacterium]MBQ6330659.1 hypothetical protein [Kiritimatiellia bacterium]